MRPDRGRTQTDEAYSHAESMLTDNWDKVEAVAEALLKYENLSADEVHSIMRGEPIGRSTVAEELSWTNLLL